MRQKLESMNKVDQRKVDRKREELVRQEKLSYKEKVAEQKKRQRQEVMLLLSLPPLLSWKHPFFSFLFFSSSVLLHGNLQGNQMRITFLSQFFLSRCLLNSVWVSLSWNLQKYVSTYHMISVLWLIAICELSCILMCIMVNIVLFLRVLTCLAWYMYTCSLSSCMFRGVSPGVFWSIISCMCDACQNGKHSVTVTMGLLQIYALNKVMTDLEYKSFEELVRTKGLNEWCQLVAAHLELPLPDCQPVTACTVYIYLNI